MAGVSEKRRRLWLVAPRGHAARYEKLDGMAIARRSVERRLAASGAEQFQPSLPVLYPSFLYTSFRTFLGKFAIDKNAASGI